MHSASRKPPAKSGRRQRDQRCWVHKIANVLGKSRQPKAKRALQAELFKEAVLAQ